MNLRPFGPEIELMFSYVFSCPQCYKKETLQAVQYGDAFLRHAFLLKGCFPLGILQRVGYVYSCIATACFDPIHLCFGNSFSALEPLHLFFPPIRQLLCKGLCI